MPTPDEIETAIANATSAEEIVRILDGAAPTPPPAATPPATPAVSTAPAASAPEPVRAQAPQAARPLPGAPPNSGSWETEQAATAWARQAHAENRAELARAAGRADTPAGEGDLGEALARASTPAEVQAIVAAARAQGLPV